MKRDCLRHPKTYDLAARLRCSRPEALGYLTLLWDFTAEQAPTGAVGRWADGAIARACDWPDAPEEFIAALVESGWLDFDPQHRLIIHDWAVHCERWVKLKLQKLGKTFAEATVECGTCDVPASAERSTERSTESSAERSPSRDLPYPTLPNPTPNPSQPCAANGGGGGDGGGDEISWEAIERQLRGLGVSTARKTARNARKDGWTAQAVQAVIAHYQAGEGRWTPAALVWRLKECDPAGDPTEGWPDPEPEAPKRAPPTVPPGAGQAVRIIRAGRKAGKQDEEITQELATAGLSWP